MKVKVCPQCKQSKPVTSEFFARNRSRKDGLQVWCKLCHNAKQNEFREENAEHYREQARLWRETHPGYWKKYAVTPNGDKGDVLPNGDKPRVRSRL